MSSERPSTRSRDCSAGYSFLSPIDRSVRGAPLQSAADVSSSPVPVVAIGKGRRPGRPFGIGESRTEDRPVTTEASLRSNDAQSRKSTPSGGKVYSDSANGASRKKQPKRRPTTSAGVLLLKDYAFGTLGPRETPQRIQSANGQQRPRNDYSRMEFDRRTCEPDQRPPSRQRPPPQALHLEIPRRSMQPIEASRADSRRRLQRPPQTSTGIRATKHREHSSALTSNKSTRASTSCSTTRRTAWSNDFCGTDFKVPESSTKSPYIPRGVSQTRPATRSHTRARRPSENRPGPSDRRPQTSDVKVQKGTHSRQRR